MTPAGGQQATPPISSPRKPRPETLTLHASWHEAFRDAAVAALTKHYSTAFREWEKPAILDICASHVSHFPPDVAEYAGRRVALGMNVLELSQNKQVTEFVAKDLNADPTLPFEANSLDTP